MEIDQLKRFLVAAELGNMSKAARELNITQPALTQSIKALEASLGGEVFIRGMRGIKLTPFGAMLVPRAQLIINETNRIRDDIYTAKKQKNARIIIGVAPYLSNYVFPQALDRLLGHLPDLAITIVEGYSTDLGRMLQSSDIDIAFCGHNEVFDTDPVLRFDETLNQKYVLMARSVHPVFKRKAISDADLSEYRWVIHDHGPVDLRIHRFFESLDLPPPRRVVRTNSQATIRALTLNTDAIALLSVDYAAPDLKRGDIRVIETSRFGFQAKAGLLYRRDAPKSPAMKSLIQEITKACAAFVG